MPIQLEIFHPDRILVGVGRGTITLQEYGNFLAEIVQAGVVHYRKIIDTTTAESTTIDKDVLMAFEDRLRTFSKGRPRGPLAVVVDRTRRGDLAETFKSLTSADRPIEIFASIHAARKWLKSLPMVE
jgi:hypothetical protein